MFFNEKSHFDQLSPKARWLDIDDARGRDRLVRLRADRLKLDRDQEFRERALLEASEFSLAWAVEPFLSADLG